MANICLQNVFFHSRKCKRTKKNVKLNCNGSGRNKELNTDNHNPSHHQLLLLVFISIAVIYTVIWLRHLGCSHRHDGRFE